LTGQNASVCIGRDFAFAFNPVFDKRGFRFGVNDIDCHLRATDYKRTQNTLRLVVSSFMNTLNPKSDLETVLAKIPIYTISRSRDPLVPYDWINCPRTDQIKDMNRQTTAAKWSDSENLKRVNQAVCPYMHPTDRSMGISLLGSTDAVPTAPTPASVKLGHYPEMMNIIDIVHSFKASEVEVRERLGDKFPNAMYEDFKTVVSLAVQYNWDYWYSSYESDSEFRRLTFGPLAFELSKALRAEPKHEDKVPLTWMCGHDATIDTMLACLGVPSNDWSPPLSHVVFAIYKDAVGTKYVRMFYNGAPLVLAGIRIMTSEDDHKRGYYKKDPTMARLVCASLFYLLQLRANHVQDAFTSILDAIAVPDIASLQEEAKRNMDKPLSSENKPMPAGFAKWQMEDM
jgi:hypothetical protein